MRATTRLGRTIALKVLHPVSLDIPENRRRVLQEARTASALNHPHIVPVYDVGTEAGSEFVAMELVDGEPLSGRILRGLALSEL